MVENVNKKITSPPSSQPTPTKLLTLASEISSNEEKKNIKELLENTIETTPLQTLSKPSQSQTPSIPSVSEKKNETKEIIEPLFKKEEVEKIEKENIYDKKFYYFKEDEKILSKFNNKIPYYINNPTNMNETEKIIIVYDSSNKTFPIPKNIDIKNMNIYFFIKNQKPSKIDSFLTDKYLTEKLSKLSGNKLFIFDDEPFGLDVFKLTKI